MKTIMIIIKNNKMNFIKNKRSLSKKIKLKMNKSLIKVFIYNIMKYKLKKIKVKVKVKKQIVNQKHNNSIKIFLMKIKNVLVFI